MLKALHFTMSSDTLNRAVSLLAQIHPEGLKDLAESIAFDSLNFRAKVAIAKELAMDARTVDLGARLLRPLMGKTTEDPDVLRATAKWFPLVLIATGLPRHALMMLKYTREQAGRPTLPEAFYLAMASWAATREISKELFKEVLDACHGFPKTSMFFQRLRPLGNRSIRMV